MSMHKDSNGNLHDDMDGTAIHLLPDGCVEISDEEAATIREAQNAPSIAELKEQAREIRDKELKGNDYRLMPDYPEPNRSAWETYRQQLRDVTAQAGWDTDPVGVVKTVINQRPL
jgi:hypothetical protein